MPTTILTDCNCCKICCGVFDEVMNVDLYATIDDCTHAPEPILLEVTSSDATSMNWGGQFFCDGDNCEMHFGLRCEYNPTTQTSSWTFLIRKDDGPGACDNCETDEQNATGGSISCGPIELIWTGVTFNGGTSCTRCGCSPAAGPITVTVTQ